MPHDPLAEFVQRLQGIVVRKAEGEAVVLEAARQAMQALVASDDWLPEPFTRADPERYRQYLLHADPDDRFCVVSFVWGPGQKTPVHDHTTWGVIGMLRGGETSEPFRREGDRVVPAGEKVLMKPGDVEMVSPAIGDIHRVVNAYDDRVSVSVHAYGANIGKVRRHVFDPQTGAVKEFVSGYANA